MNTFELKIWKDEDTNSCTLGIESFLTKDDYDMWWSDSCCVESDVIQNIRDIIEDNISTDTYIDFQIWEEGDAKVHNVDLLSLDDIIHNLEQEFGKIEIIECF